LTYGNRTHSTTCQNTTWNSKQECTTKPKARTRSSATIQQCKLTLPFLNTMTPICRISGRRWICMNALTDWTSTTDWTQWAKTADSMCSITILIPSPETETEKAKSLKLLRWVQWATSPFRLLKRMCLNPSLTTGRPEGTCSTMERPRATISRTWST